MRRFSPSLVLLALLTQSAEPQVFVRTHDLPSGAVPTAQGGNTLQSVAAYSGLGEANSNSLLRWSSSVLTDLLWILSSGAAAGQDQEPAPLAVGTVDRWSEWLDPFRPYAAAQGADVYAQMLMDWVDGTSSHTGRIHQRAPEQILDDQGAAVQLRVDVLAECARQAATAGRYRQTLAALQRLDQMQVSPKSLGLLWHECAGLVVDAPRRHRVPKALSRKEYLKLPRRRATGGDGPQAFVGAWSDWMIAREGTEDVDDRRTAMESTALGKSLVKLVDDEDFGRSPDPPSLGSGGAIELLSIGGRSNALKWQKLLGADRAKMRRFADHLDQVAVPLDRWEFVLHHDEVTKNVGKPDAVLLFRGVFVPPDPGIYKLQVRGDDGALVFLGGELCIDSWTGPVEVDGSELKTYDKYFQSAVWLTNPVTVDFALFDVGGEAALTFDVLRWVDGTWKNSSTDIRLLGDS